MADNKTPQTVASSATVPQTSTKVRFTAVSGKSANSPVFRVAVSLQGAMEGAEIEAPIYAERDPRTQAITRYNVGIPANKGFAYLKAKPKVDKLASGEMVPIAGQFDPAGERVMDNWESAILTALYEFQRTKVADQIVTFTNGK